jgi:hypothetical protein
MGRQAGSLSVSCGVTMVARREIDEQGDAFGGQVLRPFPQALASVTLDSYYLNYHEGDRELQLAPSPHCCALRCDRKIWWNGNGIRVPVFRRAPNSCSRTALLP